MSDRFNSAAFLRGVREAIGVPAAVVAAGYVGFGALASSGGISIWIVMGSTVAMWALPGQSVLFSTSPCL